MLLLLHHISAEPSHGLPVLLGMGNLVLPCDFYLHLGNHSWVWILEINGWQAPRSLFAVSNLQMQREGAAESTDSYPLEFFPILGFLFGRKPADSETAQDLG